MINASVKEQTKPIKISEIREISDRGCASEKSSRRVARSLAQCFAESMKKQKEYLLFIYKSGESKFEWPEIFLTVELGFAGFMDGWIIFELKINEISDRGCVSEKSSRRVARSLTQCFAE